MAPASVGKGRSEPPSAAGSVAGSAATAAAAAAIATSEQHAVMASVVVLSERLGARVFGTGMQMLSCIRLVLEHEQPPGGKAGVAGHGGGGSDGGGDDEEGRTGADGSGCVDAAVRVARMEAAAAAEEGGDDGGDVGIRGFAPRAAGEGVGLGGLGSGREEGAGEGEEGGDGGDTLCSIVLALLTTTLELGEEERTAEEEEELRAMLGPLKVRKYFGSRRGRLLEQPFYLRLARIGYHYVKGAQKQE